MQKSSELPVCCWPSAARVITVGTLEFLIHRSSSCALSDSRYDLEMTDAFDTGYLESRERQQRALAAKATMPDLIDFHTQLAEHYARLLEEASAIVRIGSSDTPL